MVSFYHKNILRKCLLTLWQDTISSRIFCAVPTMLYGPKGREARSREFNLEKC